MTIRLPKGQTPSFPLAKYKLEKGAARGRRRQGRRRRPDVTHQALVLARVRPGPADSGVTFKAGEGVGTVTRPGLQLAVGEPAINPVPRRMMTETVAEIADSILPAPTSRSRSRSPAAQRSPRRP